MATYFLQIQQIGQPTRRVELTGPLVIGRESGADLQIRGDHMISRRHCLLEEGDGGVRIEVLGATNATTVDDQTIAPGTAALLAVGSQIRIGRTLIVIGCGTSLETTRPRPGPPKRRSEKSSTVIVPNRELEAGVSASNAWLLLKGTSNRRRHSHQLVKAETTVGTGHDCGFRLPHDSVSVLHAELHFNGVHWDVRDLGSAAGTWIDGQRIGKAPVAMRRNTLVNFGNVPTVFVCHSPIAAAAHDIREEWVALKHLVARRRLKADEFEQVMNRTQGGHGSFTAAILMHETEVEPGEWAEAIAAARRPSGALGRLGSKLSNWLSSH